MMVGHNLFGNFQINLAFVLLHQFRQTDVPGPLVPPHIVMACIGTLQITEPRIICTIKTNETSVFFLLYIHIFQAEFHAHNGIRIRITHEPSICIITCIVFYQMVGHLV